MGLYTPNTRMDKIEWCDNFSYLKERWKLEFFFWHSLKPFISFPLARHSKVLVPWIRDSCKHLVRRCSWCAHNVMHLLEWAFPWRWSLQLQFTSENYLSPRSDAQWSLKGRSLYYILKVKHVLFFLHRVLIITLTFTTFSQNFQHPHPPWSFLNRFVYPLPMGHRSIAVNTTLFSFLFTNMANFTIKYMS